MPLIISKRDLELIKKRLLLGNVVITSKYDILPPQVLFTSNLISCRNFSLLSFGEEAEEDESTVASVSKVRL